MPTQKSRHKISIYLITNPNLTTGFFVLKKTPLISMLLVNGAP